MAAGTRSRVRPIGLVRSRLKARALAPKDAEDGAPDAWIEIAPRAAEALHGIEAGQTLVLLTWFHKARRDVFKVHPRGDRRRPMLGVFATRSPDRPNPIGLHLVTVRRVSGLRLRVGPLEAIDGTPVVDIKPARTANDRRSA